MCESNEVGRLNSLGFVGFQKEVEATLWFKARFSDPLRFPNYYKVLYSWHISRGDYRSGQYTGYYRFHADGRSAGEIMYRQGRRLAEASSTKVSTFELAAMQARSYLAAINALSLVDQRNAWVSESSAPPRALKVSPQKIEGSETLIYEAQAIKRRRVSAYIPADEFAQDKGPIDIVTLSDIKAEYTVVLSRLQLASRIQDLHEHGGFLFTSGHFLTVCAAGVSVSPEEIVGLFTQRGMYDHAQSAAASLQVDMIDMFQSLAARCVELSRFSDLGGWVINRRPACDILIKRSETRPLRPSCRRHP